MEQTETKRGLEFDLKETNTLPIEGVHTPFRRVSEQRGVILHSKDVTEAELAVARGMLRRRYATEQEMRDYDLAQAARVRSS